jgi:REP element-mobilizing transposase RayT
MPQSLVQLYTHIIFSTKHRQLFLTPPPLQKEVHRYLGGARRNLGSPSITVGGVADHVHVLCRLGKTTAAADLIRELKRDSSNWLKTKGGDLARFGWQDGYAALSVSPSHVDALIQYIAGQGEHHRKTTFQDELRRILRKYGIDYDERYLWD